MEKPPYNPEKLNISSEEFNDKIDELAQELDGNNSDQDPLGLFTENPSREQNANAERLVEYLNSQQELNIKEMSRESERSNRISLDKLAAIFSNAKNHIKLTLANFLRGQFLKPDPEMEALIEKIEALESKYDQQFTVVFKAIKRLITVPEKKAVKMGFKTE